MFTITKKYRFEAGHQLVHHDGKCRDPHGHSYVMVITLKAPTLVTDGPKTNMLMDFGDIDQVIKPLVKEKLDHKWLNDVLATDSPTAEKIAEWVYHEVKDRLPHLDSVTIHETESSSATYTELARPTI